MFVPLWLIGLTLALILVLAVLALRRRGTEMIEQQRRETPFPTTDQLAALADSEVRAALARGNKIEAIRLVRERTGLGLKESKELVERETP